VEPEKLISNISKSLADLKQFSVNETNCCFVLTEDLALSPEVKLYCRAVPAVSWSPGSLLTQTGHQGTACGASS